MARPAHVCDVADVMPNRPILWDTYEELLDEATFLWEQWEASLSTWDCTLAEVARGPEERLLAQLDALVIGGSRVADELCVPALESPELVRVAAAAWVLLHSDDGDRLDETWDALSSAEPERRDALARAFALSAREDLPARVASRFDTLALPQKACLIDVLRISDPRALANLPLSRLAAEPDPELLGAVLRAARRIPVDLGRSALERGLVSALSETRAAAIELGTSLHPELVLPRCRSVIAEGAPERRLALAALAIGGDTQDVQRLLEWAATDLGQDAVWALGFSGRVDVVDALLAWLDHARLGASAAEALATVTGLELDGDLLDPSTSEPDELPDDAPIPELEPGDDLPRPNAPLLRSWWQQNRARFELGVRYFRGQPWAPTLPASALTGTATWRLRGARLGLSRAEAASLELRGWARKARLAELAVSK
jgi:uncharacterized protein (TIGR02270 family)